MQKQIDRTTYRKWKQEQQKNNIKVGPILGIRAMIYDLYISCILVYTLAQLRIQNEIRIQSCLKKFQGYESLSNLNSKAAAESTLEDLL